MEWSYLCIMSFEVNKIEMVWKGFLLAWIPSGKINKINILKVWAYWKILEKPLQLFGLTYQGEICFGL